MLDAIQLLQLFAKDFFQQHVGGLAAACGQGLGGRQVLVAQVDQHLQPRNLGEVLFVEAEALHSYWPRMRLEASILSMMAFTAKSTALPS